MKNKLRGHDGEGRYVLGMSETKQWEVRSRIWTVRYWKGISMTDCYSVWFGHDQGPEFDLKTLLVLVEKFHNDHPELDLKYFYALPWRGGA